MAYLIAILFIITILVFALLKVSKWDRLKHIPGYRGLPVIGIAHTFDLPRMHLQMANIGKRFRGLFRAGDIVFCDKKDIAHEMMVTKDPNFASRFHKSFQFIYELQFHSEGMSTRPYDSKLQLMRKLVFQALHLHGSGLKKFEGIVLEEVRSFLDDIGALCGQQVSPRNIIYAPVINIMTSLLVGEKFDYASEEVAAVKDLDRRITRMLNIANVPEVNIFPILIHVPLPRYYRKKREREELFAVRDHVIGDVLFNRYKNFYTLNNDTSVLSSLLKEQAKRGRDVVTDTMIKSIMMDLIVAGSVTTSAAINGLVFIFAHLPGIQDRLFSDIADAIGTSSMPCVEDKNKLSFVQAVILEGLRYQSVTPLHVLRVSTEDTEVGGLIIPKDTQVYTIWCGETKLPG